jgi:Putative 2/3 transmembrane domain holin
MNPNNRPPDTPNSPFTLRVPRLSGWLVITLVLLACVWVVAPHQLPVSLYKLSLVTLASVVGYWIDRSLFPYARPDKVPGYNGLPGIAMLRRAIIVGCAMLAMGLGA